MAGNLRLRELGSAVPDVVYNTQLPASFPGEGYLAAQFESNGSLTIFQLIGGKESGGSVSTPFAINDIYSINYPAGSFFPSAPGVQNGGYTFLAHFSPGAQGQSTSGISPLNGIAAMDSKLYVSGALDGLFGFSGGVEAISEVQLGGSPSLKLVSSFGSAAVRSIAGSQDRGSLFAALSPYGSGGFAFTDALAEIDPRVNHLSNFFDLSTLLSPTSDTVFTGGANSAWLAEERIVHGFTYANGKLVAGFCSAGQDNVINTSDDRLFYVTLNPFASNGAGSPRVIRVDADSSTSLKGITGLPTAMSAPGAPSISLVYDAAFDAFGYDPFFSNMSFSTQAAGSTAFQNLIKDYILDNASNSSGCITSGILSGVTSTLLQAEANRRGGVGRVIHSLTNSLAANHPCVQVGFEDSILALFQNSSFPTSGDLFSDFDYPPTVSTTPFSLGGGTAFLEPDVGLATSYSLIGDISIYYIAGGELDPMTQLPISATNNLYAASIPASTGVFSGFSLLATIQTPDLGGVPAVLTGLGVLGGELYASRSRYEFNAVQMDPAIARINISTAQSIDVMALGMTTKGLAASDRRGSLFAAGLYDGMGSPRGAGGTRGNSYDNLALWEIDPRNKYVKNTWWGFNGDFNFSASTIQDASYSQASFPTIGHIGDVASVGRHVVISADVSFTGGEAFNSFYITVNPDGTGSTSNPFVARLAGGNGEDVRALAGELEASSFFTAAPVPLMNPAGGVDNTSINPLFAQTAYSQRALNSGLIQAVYSAHFLATSNSAAVCQGDAVFSQIPTALANHVNQVNGIGRATFDLRNPLASNHPCAGSAP